MSKDKKMVGQRWRCETASTLERLAISATGSPFSSST